MYTLYNAAYRVGHFSDINKRDVILTQLYCLLYNMGHFTRQWSFIIRVVHTFAHPSFRLKDFMTTQNNLKRQLTEVVSALY